MEEDVMESTEVDTPESSVEVSEEPSGETYAVKVDGENQEVSLDELRDGYQRQSDYTRKTQELASERRRLQQAEAIVSSLESDPEGTLAALSDAFNVQTAPPAQAVRQNEYDEYAEPVEPDVNEQRIALLEARLEQQDRLQKRQQIEKQVEGLRDTYGDFDAQELYQHALRNKIGNLEAALTHMRYGDLSDKASKLEKEQERTDAKRDAAVVEPKGSKQTGSSQKTVEEPNSIRQAFEDAKRELAS